MILGVVGTHELEVMRMDLSYMTIDLEANLRRHLPESMRERKHLWSYVRGQGPVCHGSVNQSESAFPHEDIRDGLGLA